MTEPEERTTRDGLAIVDGRTSRTGALEPLVDAVRRLEASLDRAAKLAENARAKSEQLTTEPRARTLRERILGMTE